MRQYRVIIYISEPLNIVANNEEELRAEISRNIHYDFDFDILRWEELDEKGEQADLLED